MASEPYNFNSIKLGLHDPDSWKDPIDAAMQQALPIDEINEILGSLKPINSKKTKITIDTTETNTHISHNGFPIDTHDVTRLLSIGCKNENNKKGTSIRGFGMRTIMKKWSREHLSELTEYNIHEYSYMASKILCPLEFESGGVAYYYDTGDLFIYLMDSEYNITILDNTNHKSLINCVEKVYSKYQNEGGVFFNIPTKYYEKKDLTDLKYNLRFIFNKCDYQIYLNNEIITNNKPGKILDIVYDRRYLKVRCEIFLVNNKYYALLNYIERKNIHNLNCYYCFNKDNHSKSGDKDWIITDMAIIAKIHNPGASCVYACTITMQSFISGKNPRIDYYGEHVFNSGILPYYNDNCLRHTFPTLKHANNNMKRYFKGLIAGDRPTTRGAKDDTSIYNDGQTYNAEIIENYPNCYDKPMINANVLKSHSDIHNSQCERVNGSKKNPIYIQQLPNLITYLIRKHIWDKTSNKEQANSEKKCNEEDILKLQEDKKVAEQARKVAEQDKKVAEQARKAAEQDKKAAEQARKAAEQARKAAEQDKKLAEQDKKTAEQDKKTAEQDKKTAEQAKKLADEKALRLDQENKEANEKALRLEQENKTAEQAKKEADAKAVKLEQENQNSQQLIDEKNITIDTLNLTISDIDNDVDFNTYIKAEICSDQDILIECLLCKHSWPVPDMQFCHIISKKNGGKGTKENGVYACKYCNCGKHPITHKKGMHSNNMIKWLLTTYPKTANDTIIYMNNIGKFTDNV